MEDILKKNEEHKPQWGKGMIRHGSNLRTEWKRRQREEKRDKYKAIEKMEK
jgi:hypothetical protein